METIDNFTTSISKSEKGKIVAFKLTPTGIHVNGITPSGQEFSLNFFNIKDHEWDLLGDLFVAFCRREDVEVSSSVSVAYPVQAPKETT